jgi:hypothetical protein
MSSSQKGLTLIILCAAVLILAAGCATYPGTPPATSPVVTPSPTVPAGPPAIEIVSPENGSVVPEGNVTVTVSVENFDLANKPGQANVAGEGHIHYFLDALPPTEPGKPAVTEPGTYVPTTATTYTWENVGPGTHVLAVELVNNDHTPLTPPVTRTITVTAATPKVIITSPRDVAIVGPDNFTVIISVENFRLVDSLGQANVPGEGHVHYFLDVEPPTAPGVPAVTSSGRYVPTTATSYTWFNVTGGFHIVAVELVNNDHTPLVPPATHQITVVVGREGAGGGGGGGGGY